MVGAYLLLKDGSKGSLLPQTMRTTCDYARDGGGSGADGDVFDADAPHDGGDGAFHQELRQLMSNFSLPAQKQSVSLSYRTWLAKFFPFHSIIAKQLRYLRPRHLELRLVPVTEIKFQCEVLA